MALRDQPYIPLYVQDFLTDEKLNECSAESAGVYIRLMCVMHKSQDYGVILLKQKDKQTGKQVFDFALKLVKQMPYSAEVIERALNELLEEGVLSIDEDKLFQRRMVKDGKLSDTRSLAGSKGGKQRHSNKESEVASDFAQAKGTAKTIANPENEIEYENASENDNERKRSASHGKKKSKIFDCDNRAYQAAVYLDECICKRIPSQKPADERRLQSWADAFDKCHSIDERDWDDMARVLKFSQDDPFWQQNILSGTKFREKYLQLLAKMQSVATSTMSQRHSVSSNAMSDLQKLHEMFREEELP